MRGRAQSAQADVRGRAGEGAGGRWGARSAGGRAAGRAGARAWAAATRGGVRGRGVRGGWLGGLGAAWACSWARLGVWCTILSFLHGLTRYFPESLNEHCSSRNFSKKKNMLKKILKNQIKFAKIFEK